METIVLSILEKVKEKYTFKDINNGELVACLKGTTVYSGVQFSKAMRTIRRLVPMDFEPNHREMYVRIIQVLVLEQFGLKFPKELKKNIIELEY